VYLDFKTDESYTPSKMAVSIGNSMEELYQVQTCDLDEPIGWYNFALGRKEGNEQFGPVKTSVVQLAVL
jgi:anaphase-promoting complex subunit 10